MGKILFFLLLGVGAFVLLGGSKQEGEPGMVRKITGSLLPKMADTPVPSTAPAPPVPASAQVRVDPLTPGGSPAPIGKVSADNLEVRPGEAPKVSGQFQRVSMGAPLDEPPASWGSYTFCNRELPAGQFFQDWERMGLTVVGDPVARSVTFRGPLAAADAFKASCVASDVVPGTCCVQAWTVYVDSSVQKGFDLVAALGSVLDDGFRAEMKPGGLTIDFGLEKVAGALAVIADGSTVQVVQNPYARLTDGVEAKVEAIQEYPLLETAVTQGGVAQSSIKFRKVGLQMGVRPLFLRDGRVRLAVTQTNGLIGATVRVADNEVPVIQSQTVETTAELSVGQTLILGGVRTVRRVEEKSWFSKSDKMTEGTLYVILSTYDDAPRAVPVDGPQLVSPSMLPELLPLTVPDDAHGVLPPIPEPVWQRQEREFIRGRGAK